MVGGGNRIIGFVNRREHRFHLLGVVKIIRHGKNGFSDGSNQRERRVEHQSRVGGLFDILMGVRNGDGTHGCGPSATHSSDGKRRERQQCRKTNETVFPAMEYFFRFQLRHGVEFPQQQHDDNKQHDEIPVVQQFGAENAAEVALVGKFVENRRCRAAHRVFEIDRVGQIDGQRQAVHHEKKPLANLLIGARFLAVPREEHHHNVERIGVENGRRVEDKSAPKRLDGIVQITGIFKVILDACNLIDHIDEHQVPSDCHYWRIDFVEQVFHGFYTFCISCNFL